MVGIVPQASALDERREKLKQRLEAKKKAAKTNAEGKSKAMTKVVKVAGPARRRIRGKSASPAAKAVPNRAKATGAAQKTCFVELPNDEILVIQNRLQAKRSSIVYLHHNDKGAPAKDSIKLVSLQCDAVTPAQGMKLLFDIAIEIQTGKLDIPPYPTALIGIQHGPSPFSAIQQPTLPVSPGQANTAYALPLI